DVNLHALAKSQVETSRKLGEMSASPARIAGFPNLPAFLRARGSAAVTPPPPASRKRGNGVKLKDSTPETDDARAQAHTLSPFDSQTVQQRRGRARFVWWTLFATAALAAGVLAVTWSYWRHLISDF